MAQVIKVLATNPDGVSSILGTHVVEVEKLLPKAYHGTCLPV